MCGLSHLPQSKIAAHLQPVCVCGGECVSPGQEAALHCWDPCNMHHGHRAPALLLLHGTGCMEDRWSSVGTPEHKDMVPYGGGTEVGWLCLTGPGKLVLKRPFGQQLVPPMKVTWVCESCRGH